MMDMTRLPKKVLHWDYKVGARCWLQDVLKLCQESNIPAPTGLKYVYDIEPIFERILRQYRQEWKDASEKMTKLDTYREV